jgi:tetratricopeptide (TPR) repeat protein
MSNVVKLKKQAAEYELKKQFDKALAIYVKLLDSFDEYADELDVALFNRVGDLLLRQGNVADAVDYYDRAVDRYSDTGFFNNAIALCNKILRHSPGRAAVYYKLGKISALKGFKNDAKVNFLEYADRMQKAGKVDEAFRALKEFADLCPDQDEIRLMLADQLTKADRKDEAVEQLQTLYERYETEGRGREASATAERIRAIDPTVELRSASGIWRKSNAVDLVFLDLDEPTPGRTPPASQDAGRWTTPSAPPRTPTPDRATPTVGGATTPTSVDNGSLTGITRIGDDTPAFDRTPTESLPGLEPTRLGDDELPQISQPDPEPEAEPEPLLDLEPMSMDLSNGDDLQRSNTPTHGTQALRDDETDETDEEDVGEAGAELEFIIPDDEPAPPRKAPSINFDASSLTTPPLTAPATRPTPNTTRVALEGLPLMDLDVPAIRAPAPRLSTPLGRSALPGDFELIEDPDAPHRPEDFRDLEAREPSEPSEPSELSEPMEQSPWPEDEEADTTLSDLDEALLPAATMEAAQSAELLKERVEADPENWDLHREMAEAMLEAGDRAGGIRELESAMTGADHAGDLDFASSLAEEIARLEPDVVRHHQKRVEYAFRTNDRARLIEAYLSLADALMRCDQADKSRTVYQRVLDLAPDEARARAALDTIAVPEPPPPPASPRPASHGRASASPVAEPPAPTQRSSESFVNLGDWLRDDEGPKDTRMVVAEQEPTGDEDADFADMLRKFKQGVAENVDAEDYQSHYDLAIAFKEMGLLDEAISEFQKALGGANKVPTYEALGQCFMEKGQFKLATSVLIRALNERASEDQLVGVLYLLGRSAEEQGMQEEALGYYHRVFVLDIQFRDVADRINEMERAAR